MSQIRIHPGEVLAEDFMKPRGLDTATVAGMLDMPETEVAAVIATTAAVTPELAAKLAAQFGATPEEWLKLQAVHDREANLPVAEQQQRHWYIHWLTSADANLDPLALLELTTLELGNWSLALLRDMMLANVQWGAANAASASDVDRKDVIDGAVGTETHGRFYGTEPVPEPTAGGCVDQAPLFWARERRRHLEKMSGTELATECANILAVEAAQSQRHDAVVSAIRRTKSSQMSKLVNVRYDYTRALIETAKHFRNRGKKVKEAIRRLEKTPYECADGTTISSNKGDLVVQQGDRVTRITHNQFTKRYWPRGLLPPTTVGGNHQPLP